MSLRKAVRTKLRNGFRFFGYDIRITLQKSDWTKHGHPILLGQIDKLLEMFPEYSIYRHDSIERSRQDCVALLDLINALIPLRHEQAVESHLRTLLNRHLQRIEDQDYKRLVQDQIALSRFRGGDSDTARFLLASQGVVSKNPEAIEKIRSDLSEYERYYESKSPFFEGERAWSQVTRGANLVYLMGKHRERLRGKKILHIAPEEELRGWFEKNRADLGVEYLTLDGFRPDVDLVGDLTRLPLEAGFADMIICHRVLEHILDDRGAMRELHRVLRPGGILNVSVPQSMHREETVEWIVPDESLHGHVRQYGRDFERRLEEAGFKVEVERSLLDLSHEEHQRNRTSPLRLYNCKK